MWDPYPTQRDVDVPRGRVLQLADRPTATPSTTTSPSRGAWPSSATSAPARPTSYADVRRREARNLDNGTLPEAEGLRGLGPTHLHPAHDVRVGYDRLRGGRPGRAAALQRLRQRPAADRHRRARARSTRRSPTVVADDAHRGRRPPSNGTVERDRRRPPTTSAVTSVVPAGRRSRGGHDRSGHRGLGRRSAGTARRSPTAPTPCICGRATRPATPVSPTLVSVTVQNVDDEPPTPPAGLTGDLGHPEQGDAGLVGRRPTTRAVTGYRVYRDGDLVPIASASGPAARVRRPRASRTSRTHTYTVTALDAAGQRERSEQRGGRRRPGTTPRPPSRRPQAAADRSRRGHGDVGRRDRQRGRRPATGSTATAACSRTVTDGSDTLVDDGLDDGVTYSYRVIGVRRCRQLQHRSATPSAVTTPDAHGTDARRSNLERRLTSAQSVALSVERRRATTSA